VSNRKKILAIDDEEDLRIILKEELTDEGYEVFTLGDPEKAMDRIEATKPDLVLLDIKMPGMSGMDLLNLVREKYYNLPVILLTAYSSFKKDIAAAACDQYVVKSGDFTELKKRIRKTLSVTT
jgi:DNA-binding response OmpR family regulator